MVISGKLIRAGWKSHLDMNGFSTDMSCTDAGGAKSPVVNKFGLILL